MNDPTSAPVLATRSLVLSRGGRAVATLPDIDLRRGQSIAILGASGSGKTTALMALSGIRAPASGEISVDGIAPWRLPPAARDLFRGRRIGLVFQTFHLIDAVSVAANLELAAYCAGVRATPARVAALLGALGIGDLASVRADRISHGQAQRVAVARALVNGPALICADEPTSALDDDAAARLLDLLKENAEREGAALVIATHDKRVIGSVDEVMEMRAAA